MCDKKCDKMKTHLYLKQANRDGTRQVYVSISFNGRRTQNSLGVSLNEQQFALVNKALTGENVSLDTPSKTAYNIYIKIVAEMKRIEESIANGFISPFVVDVNAIINTSKGKGATIKEHDLKHLFLQYITQSSKASNLTEGTNQAKLKILNSLLTYGATFTSISSVEGLEQYADWLQTKKVSNVTIKNYINIVKAFLNWCSRMCLCNKSFESYSYSLKKNDRT